MHAQQNSPILVQEDDCHAQLMVFYPNRQPVPYKLHCGE